MSDVPFVAFPKIPRLSKGAVIVTEKIDGTNAQIYINDDKSVILAGSRNRWITPDDDNFGFARWVEENKEMLFRLGPGTHYGEWWGSGIQRRYGLNEKRFSLFNAYRYEKNPPPECCHIVPVLHKGGMEGFDYTMILTRLVESGSVAAPGFMDPEGIIIYFTEGRQFYKKLIKNDDKHKGEM